jgi:hypothetical protein
MRSCNDPRVAGKAECVGHYTDSSNTTMARQWSNSFPNFDNTGNALLCCFITATLNGYTEIMKQAMSAPVEPDMQPRAYINPGAFFWYAAARGSTHPQTLASMSSRVTES